MTYVVAEPCIGTKDRACVEVCPVECFYEGKDQLYIHPDECIDCAACEPVCPVTAISPEDSVPEQWKHYIQKQAKFIEEHPEAPHALTKEMLGDQDNLATTFTIDGKQVELPDPPSGFGGPAAPKAEAKQAPKAEAATPAAPKEEVPAPAPAAPKAQAQAPTAQPTVQPIQASGDAVSLMAEAAAAAAEAAARAAQAAAAAVRMLQGKADGRTGNGGSSALLDPPQTTVQAARPAPQTAPKAEATQKKPGGPVPEAQAARATAAGAEKPDQAFESAKQMLYALIAIEGNTRPFDPKEVTRAEELAGQLHEEVAQVAGKQFANIRDLEKKDIRLRQKLELANEILDHVGRTRILREARTQRRASREQLAPALICFAIAAIASGLGFLYAMQYAFVTTSTPTLKELLSAPFSPEGFMPFVGLNTLAGIFGLFGVLALLKMAKSWAEACQLEALLPREFGAASLKPRHRSWVYRLDLESPRLLATQKMLDGLATRRR